MGWDKRDWDRLHHSLCELSSELSPTEIMEEAELKNQAILVDGTEYLRVLNAALIERNRRVRVRDRATQP